MQMNEMENILQMEKEIFEENSKKANEELDRKRMDVNSEAEALAEIIKGWYEIKKKNSYLILIFKFFLPENKAIQLSIKLKHELEYDDEK